MCMGCKRLYPDGTPAICHNIKADDTQCREPKPKTDVHMGLKTVKDGVVELIRRIENFEQL